MSKEAVLHRLELIKWAGLMLFRLGGGLMDFMSGFHGFDCGALG
jgi:hypothetical protein